MPAAPRSESGFYDGALGRAAADLLRTHLGGAWPESAGLTVLGLGHAAPFLDLWRDEAAIIVDAVLARDGAGAPGRCAVDDERLPFPDLSVDRVLLVHGLETASNARRLLRELWRVLRDDGTLLIVTPNRGGLWARAEKTPFGHGQPYSRRQLDRLLGSTLFRAERHARALFLPPLDWPPLTRTAALWERYGQLFPAVGGVIVTLAVKDMYAAIPAVTSLRRAKGVALCKPAL